MHIAASSPDYIRQEDVPAEVLEKEKEIYREQASQSGKPEKVWDKIAEGRLEKFYQETCLLDQPFVKNPDTAVGQLIQEVAGKVGENVVIRRFARFQLGQ